MFLDKVWRPTFILLSQIFMLPIVTQHVETVSEHIQNMHQEKCNIKHKKLQIKYIGLLAGGARAAHKRTFLHRPIMILPPVTPKGQHGRERRGQAEEKRQDQ